MTSSPENKITRSDLIKSAVNTGALGMEFSWTYYKQMNIAFCLMVANMLKKIYAGRGTPFSAPAPTLKISTNTPLAEKKGGWIDFNTGVIADGEKTIDEAAKDLLDLVIRVASGEQTKAEKHGFREISIFKDGVVL